MTRKDPMKRWMELIESRGISGIGARETAQEKRIVERSVIDEFCSSVRELLSVNISQVREEKPPLPDFSGVIEGQALRFEVAELIDPELIKQAKHIRKSESHPLHNEHLWFETSDDWFYRLLLRTIENKDQIYRHRETKIDVLLVWNEAEQIGIEDTDRWLQGLKMPDLTSISAVYFQSWYRPSYRARPTWSVIAHRLIGELKPQLSVE